MRHISVATAILCLACFASPARAQKKSSPSLANIQLECFKGQGGYYDAQTKQWTINGTEMDMLSKTDAVRKCVAEKTGKPADISLRERRLN
jgi:hypothetical protein